MNTQHTPGPWKASGLNIHNKTEGGSFLCIANVCNRECVDSAHYANARLIAAAPDFKSKNKRL